MVGVGAFFVHYYWTKIGVAEIWNNTKWSSMRSSAYRTLRRFTRKDNDKLVSEPSQFDESVYSDDMSLDQPMPNPRITSYIPPSNNTVQKPVSVISYDHPGRGNYDKRPTQPMGSTQIPRTYEKKPNQYYDLASTIQKQRF